jgi:predicted nucleic acid-binding protein
VYFDTAYIAKFYFNEPDSARVRELVRSAALICSSALALAEFHGVIHRRLRDSECTRSQARDLSARLSAHIEAGLWTLIPLTEALLRTTSKMMISAPNDVVIRTADAIHLATAAQAGEHEIWTNDRHMLSASAHFGLTGRSV